MTSWPVFILTELDPGSSIDGSSDDFYCVTTTDPFTPITCNQIIQ